MEEKERRWNPHTKRYEVEREEGYWVDEAEELESEALIEDENGGMRFLQSPDYGVDSEEQRSDLEDTIDEILED